MGPLTEPPQPSGIARRFALTLAVWLAILLTQLYPFRFAAGTGPLFALYPCSAWAVLGQVALFIPLGLSEASLARRLLGRPSRLILALVFLDAMILSLIGETAQHWLPDRSSSLIDLAANTLGAVIGYMIWLYAPSPSSPNR